MTVHMGDTIPASYKIHPSSVCHHIGQFCLQPHEWHCLGTGKPNVGGLARVMLVKVTNKNLRGPALIEVHKIRQFLSSTLCFHR